jgi:hypothetical protein
VLEAQVFLVQFLDQPLHTAAVVAVVLVDLVLV